MPLSHIPFSNPASHDRLLAEAVRDCNERLAAPVPELQVRLVLLDAGTCRETTELDRLMRVDDELRQGRLTVLVWLTDREFTPELEKKFRSQIHKRVAILRDGPARTLGDLVRMEAEAMRFAEDMPLMWPGGWEKKFESHLAATDLPTLLACWYGDSAAKKLGHLTLGFPEGAGRIYSRAQASRSA